MTITFPRELPDYELVECTFDLMDNVSKASSAKGLQLNLSRVAVPVWKAKIQTTQRPRTEVAAFAAWSSWKKSLRGLNPFVAYDIDRPAPLAYLSASGPEDISLGWDGTATVTSLGLSGALGLSVLPAGYQAKAGDRIGLEEGGRYGYYEIIEDVTASGGGIATATVSPFLHTTIFTTSAVARLWRPKCRFILDWNSWNAPVVGDSGSIAFDAYQRL